MAQLNKEIQMMSQTQHPNIIKYYESFESDGNIYLVTELADTDLFQILQDAALPAETLQRVAYQTLNVLNFLHSNRICHRDVKPQNVLVSGGVCKLCDFGFARQLSDQTMALNSIKGSPIYLAPEIARGQTYGFSSDIWSLGVMLFELSTQHPPFIARDYI